VVGERNALTNLRGLLPAIALLVSTTTGALAAEPAGRITGVGGIFFKSKDPKALMAWYRDVLGIKVEAWGGAAMAYDAPGHPPVVVVNAFKQESHYMDPSTRDYMIDFAVDDLSAFLDRLKAKGVAVLKRDDSDPSGKFAWIVDPDGTKIELWEPPAAK
jgi:predicted enzyme related to lactoylglutathione lyase